MFSYSFSTNLSSTYNFTIQVQSVGVPPLSSYPTYSYDTNWQTAGTTQKIITLTTAGWLMVGVRKNDNSSFTLTDVTNIISSHFQLEIGSTVTTYYPYQNLNIEDTGWIPIEYTSNDWQERDNNVYRPRYRKIGKVVFLQGQFATKQTLNAGSHNITVSNLPIPVYQHSFSKVSFGGKIANCWFSGNTMTIRIFENNYSDTIGFDIDSCYIAEN